MCSTQSWVRLRRDSGPPAGLAVWGPAQAAGAGPLGELLEEVTTGYCRARECYQPRYSLEVRDGQIFIELPAKRGPDPPD